MYSIVIPTLNRATILRNTLWSISNLEKPNKGFEVIIVDNGSEDETKAVVSDFERSHPSIQVLYLLEETPGLLSGRHLGAKYASGEVLSFIDDDVYLNPGWLVGLEELTDSRPAISLFTGPNLPVYESYPPDWVSFFFEKTPYGGSMCTWLSLLDLGVEEVDIHPNYVFGLNFSIRRNVFETLGGFHPDCIPDHLQHFQGDGETGLTMKAFQNGHKALYSSRLMLYHLVPARRMIESYFAKRAFYQGVADSYTKLRMRVPPKVPQVKAKSLRLRIFQQLYRIYAKRNNSRTVISEPGHILSLRSMLQGEYQRGFDFHQKAYNADPSIRDWVLKENYLDYSLPK